MAIGQQEDVARRSWTRQEFYRLLDLGFFEGQRVELIGGEILLMPPQKNFHALGIKLTEDALNAAFGLNYWVRVQMTLDLDPHSAVDPDLAVITGNVRTHLNDVDNPTTALLVVEVSVTTLYYDRGPKASLYAGSGIDDYWILNVVDRQLEVYRDPVADPGEPFGFRYASRTDLEPSDTVSPLAAPGATISVADLLP